MARLTRAHGFTLIELLIVVLIIGVLVAVSAPSFLGQTDKAHDSVAKQYLALAYKAAKAETVDNDGLYTPVNAADPAARLVTAISASEPELTVASGEPQSSDPPRSVYVTGASSPSYVALCNRSGSGRYWTLYASSTGSHHFVEGDSCLAAPPVGCAISGSVSTDTTGSSSGGFGASASGAGSAYFQSLSAMSGTKYYWPLGDATAASSGGGGGGGGGLTVPEAYGSGDDGTYQGSIGQGDQIGSWGGGYFNAAQPTEAAGFVSPGSEGAGDVRIPTHPGLGSSFTIDTWFALNSLVRPNFGSTAPGYQGVTLSDNDPQNPSREQTFWFSQGVTGDYNGEQSPIGWGLVWNPSDPVTDWWLPGAAVPTSGYMTFFSGSGASITTTTPIVLPGRLTHVTVTGDGTTLSLYVNGALAKSQPEGSVSSSGFDLTIGTVNGNSAISGWWEYFHGAITGLAIVNRALTPTEITTLQDSDPANVPHPTSLPTIDDSTPVVGSTLTADPGDWGASATGFTYQWQSSTDGSLWTDIASANDQTYTVQPADTDGYLRVVVHDTSGDCTGAATSAPVGPVQAIPVVTAQPQIQTATPQESLQVNVSNGTWFGSPTSYSYQWLRCDSAGANCVTIAGAIGQGYSPVAADVGHRLQAQVTAHNEAGQTEADSNVSNAVVYAPPTLTTAAAISAAHTPPNQGDVLTASASFSSSDSFSKSYVWERCDVGPSNCAVVSGATSATFTTTSTDLNKYLRVTVTATNATAPNYATSSSALAGPVQPPPGISLSFGATTNLSSPVGGTTNQMFLSDLNGDGRLDLLIAGNGGGGSSGFGVKLGQAGGYATGSLTVMSNTSGFGTIGDWNGDGKADLGAPWGNSSGTSMAVKPGNGDGTFGGQTSATGSWLGSWMTSGDLDGDGRSEFLIASGLATGIPQIERYNGTSWSETQLPSPGTSMNGFTVADVNGDGKKDVVGLRNGTSGNSFTLGLVYYRNTSTVGSMSFAAPVTVNTLAGTAARPYGSIVTGDFNGDGKVDVAFAYYGDPGGTANPGDGHLAVMLGNGDGTFQAAQTSTLCAGYQNPQGLTVADVNNDGKLDVAAACNMSNGAVSIALGNGDGTMQAGVQFPWNAVEVQVLLTDVNSDGKLDMLILHSGAVVGLRLNTGS